MNVKRFTARTSRDALNLVRQAFGDEAVVLSTKPCAEGVEVLAMAPDGMQQIEKVAEKAPMVRGAELLRAAQAALSHAVPSRMAASASASASALAAESGFNRAEPNIDQDVEKLAMSTLSFQDYVRERLLRRRQTELGAADTAPAAAAPRQQAKRAPVLRDEVRHVEPVLYDDPLPEPPVQAEPVRAAAVPRERVVTLAERRAQEQQRVAQERELAERQTRQREAELRAAERRDNDQNVQRREAEMMSELRSMKGLIEERFGALAFMEKLQRSPRQANLTQKLLDCGFSPALVRKLGEALPADAGDETAWAAGVLERNVFAAEHEPALEDVGGVYALIGSTGVGKTTSTAKIAAAFATKHGAANLGLITLDAYRVAAHEQLRTYGRILGVPVHTAHDRASLEDLLELLSAKKMVLIDTAGMAQRDARTRELLDMLSHRAIQKLLVINAAAQGETIEDVVVSYRASACRGVVVSKLDEAVKLGPALDALIRHKLKIIGVANGQRVPEDWHRLSSQALVQRALRASPAPSWRMDASDVNLVFAGAQAIGHRATPRAPQA